MIDNSNKDLNTDWQVNDVFKPKNANSLTSHIPYDYIITEKLSDLDQKSLYQIIDPNEELSQNKISIFLNTTTDQSGSVPTIVISDLGSFFDDSVSNPEVHLFINSPIKISGSDSDSINLYIHSNKWNYVELTDQSGSAGKVYLGYVKSSSTNSYSFSELTYEELDGVISNSGTTSQKSWMTNSSTRGNSSNGTCIITDFDVISDGIPSFMQGVFSGLYETLNAGNTLVFHNASSSFDNIVSDTAGPISGNGWSYSGPGNNWYDEFPWFRFNDNENTLDIYTWFAYKGIDNATGLAKWYVNNKWSNYLGIMANDLKEGLVYEIRVHIVSLPPSDPREWGEAAQIEFNEWASPISELVSPGTKDSDSLEANIKFQIYFTGSVTGQCSTWGAPTSGTTSSCPYIIPSFHRPLSTSDNNSYSRGTSGVLGRAFDTIAEANIRFVRLANKVYLMTY